MLAVITGKRSSIVSASAERYGTGEAKKRSAAAPSSRNV